MPETDETARSRRAQERAAQIMARLSSEAPHKGVPLRTVSGRSDAVRAPPQGCRQSGAPSYPVEGGWWDRRLDVRSSFTHAAYLDAVDARPRVHPRRRHLSDEPVAAVRGAAHRVAVGAVSPHAHSQRRAVRRVLRNAGRVGPQRLARAFPARGRTTGASRRARSRGRCRAGSAPSTTARSDRR